MADSLLPQRTRSVFTDEPLPRGASADADTSLQCAASLPARLYFLASEEVGLDEDKRDAQRAGVITLLRIT